MSLHVEMKTTYGNDSVEIMRYCLNKKIPILEIQDVMSPKEGVKKRIGYRVVAAPESDEQSVALQDFLDLLSFNTSVRIRDVS